MRLVYQRRGPLQLLPQEDQVFRETALPGAVLTRIAASHLRAGTFQFFAARGETEISVSLRITLLHATTQRRAMQINPT